MKFVFFFLLLVPAFAAAYPDDDFLAAREAFRNGNAAQLERLSDRLQGSPLEPYLTYYKLRMHWAEPDTSRIREYLSRPDDTPVIDQFRVEWLKYLAKRQRWDEFAAILPRVINSDDELDCYKLQMRLRNDEDSVLRQTRIKWFSGSGQPESCSTLFDYAIKKQAITEQDIWTRMRLALEAGNVSLAKQLLDRLPMKKGFSANALSLAWSNPSHYLNKTQINKNSAAERLVALFALHRLSKQSPQLALARWEKISDDFPDAEQHYFYGWLAYEAARQQNPQALKWYKIAGDTLLNETQLEWRARAALRAQDWHEVWASITSMSVQQQRDTTWIYWKARALEAMGQAADAKLLFGSISGQYNFYGQLAAEELGTGAASSVDTFSFQPSMRELDEIQDIPGIQRSLALYRMELRLEASREWAWAIRNFNDHQLLLAAELARRNAMYDRSINTAERTAVVHDFNLRYPAPYRDTLQEQLQVHGLEEAWVYGLMRQESRFATHAKSGVGAAGLMQIMPATARWVARKMGMRGFRSDLIHDAEINLKLGTYYMKNVLSTFDNNAVMASAAYNAGPARARQWRGDQALEGAIYIETIPFDETREYVKKVMSNTEYYSKLFDQKNISLKQRLGIIGGKTPENQKPIADEQ